MKKNVLLVTCCCLFTWGGYAQNSAEWLRQKRTQTRYLIEQILANGVYQDYLKKGYRVLQGGLNIIGEWKSREFDLHTQYLEAERNGLLPVIPKMWTARFAELSRTYIRESRALSQLCQSGSHLGSKEQHLIYQVIARLEEQYTRHMDSFIELATFRSRALNDRQRLESLNKLMDQLGAEVSLLANFQAEVSWLLAQRKAEQRDLSRVRNWYGQGGEAP